MFGVKLLTLAFLVLPAGFPWPFSWFLEEPDPKARAVQITAEDLFLKKREFLRAARFFKNFTETAGIQNASLYVNQGNAFFLAGDLPEAILAYRRGLRPDPGHRRLQENLEYARNQIAYPTPQTRPSSPGWPPWLPFPSPDLVLLLAVMVYALACVSLTRWLMVGRGRRRTVALGGLAIALGLSAWLLLQQQSPDPERPLVVVTSDNTPFCLGNGTSYFPRHREIPSLPRGLEARRLHQRGDWLQIQLASGDIGWVPSANVLVD